MIEARELTKRYCGTTAVHSLSCTIAPGTAFGVLGLGPWADVGKVAPAARQPN